MFFNPSKIERDRIPTNQRKKEVAKFSSFVGVRFFVGPVGDFLDSKKGENGENAH